uniref:Uncharacterized protein n=1 Tax=Grammatophora oceanica TaxID=210454 RepID=A0A7S1UU12_9STRA|mmetsp:Transcript_23083/g.34199  ORF Transcript_23083/g.34199 Transcript_23083/m.34199 type:complete len:305 (+) Transcript_23083:1473-2387(+)
MESLLYCSEIYYNDDNATNNEPLQESELAIIVEVMKRRRRSTASSTASFSNNNDDHHHHATIQGCGFLSLGILAENVTNRERIARVGGLDVVPTNVLKQYASDEEVQCDCFSKIFTLAWNNPTNQAAIMAQYDASPSSFSTYSQPEEQEEPVDEEEKDDDDVVGIVDWILETMKARFPNSTQVQFWGCLVLGALSQNNPRHAKRIGGSQGGAIEVVLDAMRRFSSSNDDDDEGVVFAGCFALESMVGAVVENQARMKDLLEEDGGSSLDFVRDERKKLSSAMKSALDSWLSDLDKRFLFPKEDK